MLSASPPATMPTLPWVALRAFWRIGAVVAVGDVLQLTRSEAAELLAAHKIAPARDVAPTPAQADPAPAPAALPASATAAAPRRPRKPKGG
jgi:hypothetical protein